MESGLDKPDGTGPKCEDHHHQFVNLAPSTVVDFRRRLIHHPCGILGSEGQKPLSLQVPGWVRSGVALTRYLNRVEPNQPAEIPASSRL